MPPTIEEWLAYAEEVGYPKIDAEGTWNRYVSNGWIVGKTKAKDWKACLRYCFSNFKKWTPKFKPLQPQQKGVW